MVRSMHERPAHSCENVDHIYAQHSSQWPEPTVLCRAGSGPTASRRIHGVQAICDANDIYVAGYGMYHAVAMYALLPALWSCPLEHSADDLQAAILPASSPPVATQLQAKQLQGASTTAAQPPASGAAVATPAVTIAPPAIVPPPGAQHLGSAQPAAQATPPDADVSAPPVVPVGHSKR